MMRAVSCYYNGQGGDAYGGRSFSQHTALQTVPVERMLLY